MSQIDQLKRLEIEAGCDFASAPNNDSLESLRKKWFGADGLIRKFQSTGVQGIASQFNQAKAAIEDAFTSAKLRVAK